MGVDIYAFDFLLKHRTSDLGDALCLGRQGFNIARSETVWNLAESILTAHDSQSSLSEIAGASGFADEFLRYLGCRSIRSMDISPFEGAELIYDLNKPVPAGYASKFDFIFDGGTLEHVYNFPIAVTSIRRMLRPGGLFISINGANNQLGHGLYQFSPELFWRVFGTENGFTIERMQLMPMGGAPAPIPVTDPSGVRQEIGPTQAATYLMMAARRTDAPGNDAFVPYQSDYAAAWGSRT